jgi:hypothetical protein
MPPLGSANHAFNNVGTQLVAVTNGNLPSVISGARPQRPAAKPRTWRVPLIGPRGRYRFRLGTGASWPQNETSARDEKE